MTDNSTSTRRRFLKGGALLAAPIAAASIGAVALAGDRSGDSLQSRLTRLEDEAAIRELHRSWLRRFNSGEREAQIDPQLAPQPDSSVRRITAHHAGAPDRIDIAAGGLSAVGYFDSTVELETPLARDSTLAQMAHLQGNGTVRRIERQLLTVSYTRTGGAWAMRKVALRSV